MDFLSQIKNTISAKTIENLASYLGEKPNDVESGFGLSINSFLAGLLKYAHSDVELKNILKVLNDGGHTGDILNNIESFSSNFEKTQLLVTIGTNIVTYFIGNKTNLIVEKISGISEIKKTSSTSLLCLSAPIVLGFIGKTVKEKKLDLNGLRNHLREINISVINALPPAISNIFQLKKIVHDQKDLRLVKEKPKKIVINNKSENKWVLILPWVFLALAGLGVLYYSKFRKPNIEAPITQTTTEEILNSGDFLPDSNVYSSLNKTNIVPVAPKEKVERDTIIDKKNIAQPIEEIKKIIKVKPLPQEVVKAKDVQKNANSISKIAELKKVENTKITAAVKTSTSLESTPLGWTSILGSIFKKNSAEISSTSGINSIVNTLRNSSKKIKISPLSEGNRTLGEDRAYALKDALIEKGIDPDRIEIGSTQKGGNQNGIAYRISN